MKIRVRSGFTEKELDVLYRAVCVFRREKEKEFLLQDMNPAYMVELTASKDVFYNGLLAKLKKEKDHVVAESAV